MLEIFNINPLRKGDLLATVSVRVKPWKTTFHEVLVFQKGANRFIKMPSRKYENKDGEVKYIKLIEFDDSAAENRFYDHIKLAIDEYIEREGDLVPADIIKEDDPLPW